MNTTATRVAQPVMYLKLNGYVVQVAKAWMKVNGSMVEQDISELFSTSDNLVKG